jgi:hypothetical protein
MGVSTRGTALTGNPVLWKASTAVFAVLWLLTLFFYFRRTGPSVDPVTQNGNAAPGEKELLKSIQQACQGHDASTARNSLAQWIRNYAPLELRGSMRDFGVSCRDPSLRKAIAELDASGFNDNGAGTWQGESLWRAFKHWQASAGRPPSAAVGDKPDLYAR